VRWYGGRWALALAVCPLLAAGCSDDDGTEAGDGGFTTFPLGTATTVAVPTPIDACALVEDTDLASVFPQGPPEPSLTDYGAGFSECEWEQGDALVLVSVVPVDNFGPDYVDQLNVTGPVDAEQLGNGAVAFPGVVGIGRASGGGTTVGFTTDANGVLVAVRSGADEGDADLPAATRLAIVVAENL
jgi:hypothetical protein